MAEINILLETGAGRRALLECCIAAVCCAWRELTIVTAIAFCLKWIEFVYVGKLAAEVRRRIRQLCSGRKALPLLPKLWFVGHCLMVVQLEHRCARYSVWGCLRIEISGSCFTRSQRHFEKQASMLLK